MIASLRRLAIHLLLMVGFALCTFGLLEWYRIGFTLLDLTSIDLTRGTTAFHPLAVLILGVAMIPPAFRELDLLNENGRQPSTTDQEQGLS